MTGMTSLKIVEIVDYWPEVVDDLSLVTWSHGTNSHDQLHQALSDDTMMIEADVSIGPDGQPIMAHPPVTISDLSLQQFLDLVIAVSQDSDFKFRVIRFIIMVGDREGGKERHQVRLQSHRNS